MIGSAILTSVSILMGQVLIILSIYLAVYIFVFFGVSPIWKGLFLALIPFLPTWGIISVLELLPSNFYEKWLVVDTVRGNGPASVIFLINLYIVQKIFNVVPYIKTIEKKSSDNHKIDA